MVHWYQVVLAHISRKTHIVERVQTGVRMEKRLLKVLKALADYRDMTLGDLLEGIVLHAFEGKRPFAPATVSRIRDLKAVYGLDLRAAASHKMREASRPSATKRRKR